MDGLHEISHAMTPWHCQCSFQNSQTRLDRSGQVLRAVHDSDNSILKQGGSKIDEKTDLKVREANIGLDLLLVNGSQHFNGLQFNDDPTLDQKIRSEANVKTYIFI